MFSFIKKFFKINQTSQSKSFNLTERQVDEILEKRVKHKTEKKSKQNIDSNDDFSLKKSSLESIIPSQPLITNLPISIETTLKSEDLVEQFGDYDPTLDLSNYEYPHLDLLDTVNSDNNLVSDEELGANKNKIVDTLKSFNIEIESIKATIGCIITLYEIIPVKGIRISKIKNLEEEIAFSLSTKSLRIITEGMGINTIGIEVVNKNTGVVTIRSVLATEKFQQVAMDLPMILGKTIANEVYIADLTEMPHLLVAGATGQGKTVCLNTILTSLLYKKHPSQLKFVLIDPKRVELVLYNKIERHFLAKLPGGDDAIITDTEKVINTLNSLCIELDQRYDLLKDAQSPSLKEYNDKFVKRKLNPNSGHRFLPYIVLVIDEFSDLIDNGNTLHVTVERLAKLGRLVGIHIIIATQRPTADVVSNSIKINFPYRISFKVSSSRDSKIILDDYGAEKLSGKGDMLLTTGNELIRLQCALTSISEVDKITYFIGNQRGYPDAYLLPEYIDENGEGLSKEFDPDDIDPLFEEAAKLVVEHQQGSTSLIQRKMKLGYNRAGRIIDQLEGARIIGRFEGSTAREVLIPDLYALKQFLANLKSSYYKY